MAMARRFCAHGSERRGGGSGTAGAMLYRGRGVECAHARRLSGARHRLGKGDGGEEGRTMTNGSAARMDSRRSTIGWVLQAAEELISAGNEPACGGEARHRQQKVDNWRASLCSVGRD